MDNGFIDAFNLELTYGYHELRYPIVCSSISKKRKHFKEYNLLMEKAIHFRVHFLLICGYWKQKAKNSS